MKQPINILYFAFVVLATSFSSSSLTQQDYEMHSVNLGKGVLYFGNMAVNKDGTVLITGWSDYDDKSQNSLAPYGANDIWLIKLNTDYTLKWKKSFGSFADETNSSITICEDGHLILACSSGSTFENSAKQRGYGKTDLLVMELDSEGELIWEQFYGTNQNDNLKLVVQQKDGSILLCGNSEGQASGTKSSASFGKDDFWIINLNREGEVLWEKSLGTSQIDYLTDASLDQKGNIYVVGLSDSIGFENVDNDYVFSDLLFYKLNSQGTLIWENKLVHVRNARIVKLAVSGSSSYLGFTSTDRPDDQSNQLNDFRLLKYNKDGNLIWDRYYGGTKSDILRNILYSQNDQLLLGGFSNSGRGGDKTENARSAYDFWIVALDTNGVRQWDKTIFSREENYLKSICEVGQEAYLCSGPSAQGLALVKVTHKRI